MYGTPLKDVAVENVTFVSAYTGKVVEGSFAFDEPDAVLGAGAHEVGWTFTPDDSNYLPISGKLEVKVEKAVPELLDGEPTADAMVYHPARTLAAVDLLGGEASVPGAWTWDEQANALPVPGGTFACTFTPADSANYEPLTAQVEVAVSKAAPVLSVAASGITYGQTLNDSELSGKAVHPGDDATTVEGTFTWVGEGVKPMVADSGETLYTVDFMPEDAKNYEPAETKVTLEVEKAKQPDVVPEESYEPQYTVKKPTNEILPEGWAFDEADLDVALEVGKAATFTVRYVAEDAGNYEHESMGVTVTRQPCEHEWGDWKVTTEPTCTELGEQERKCAICGDVEAQSIDALGHDWPEEYTVDAEPTCTEEGSESIHCLRCDVVKEGSARTIDALGHDFAWVTVEEATCTKEGIEHEVCTRCDETGKERELDKLAHEYAWVTVAPATCAEDGLEREACSICGEPGAERAIPATGEHSWGAWEAVTPATVEAPGLERRTCSVCGEAEEREVAKLEPALPAKVTGEVSPDNPVAAAAVESQITGAKSDADPAGSTFGLLRAKGAAKSKASVKVSWSKVAGATAYVVYGNKCGKGNKFKKIKTVKGTSLTQKKLKKGTYYKYLVVAVKGDAALATSKTIHVATKGGKVGNDKSVATAAKKGRVALKKGKSFKLKAKAVAQSKKLKVKKHRAIAYESSDPSVATVSKKGVVKAKGKGACTVYAYAQDGVAKAVKVTVK